MRKLLSLPTALIVILAGSTALALAPGAHVSPHPALAPEQIIPAEYEIAHDGVIDVVVASFVSISQSPDGARFVHVDGQSFQVGGPATVSTGGGQSQAMSDSTTVTQLPGGGSRTDIDHGDGSSTTIIHDPAAGNGSSRTTVSHTDSEGNTTTTTTTTESDGTTTTTTTTS
ncbi:MAG: hypothetical protein KDK70_14030 [Myxococcales bacterium]|nr:hypothetical protein [Myxococcales bacterium]